eukprot:2217386-Pyramimonas_sp.AAC.1
MGMALSWASLPAACSSSAGQTSAAPLLCELPRKTRRSRSQEPSPSSPASAARWSSGARSSSQS